MANQPNVLIYVSDSLRTDHVSCFGYERETTPNLDAFSEDAHRFRNAFSQAIWTSPSSASILTGLYPGAHGTLHVEDQIPDNLPRLPEKLNSLGYKTGAFSTVDQVSRMRNFQPGFDRFEEIFENHPPHDSNTAKLCTDRFTDWVGSGSDKPFFGFVWSLGTHTPFFPRAGEFTDDDIPINGTVPELKRASQEQAQTVVDLYDDTIRYADKQFGRLIRHLKSVGEYEDTMIFFLGDHGELLSEHGRLEQIPNWIIKLIKATVPDFSSKFRIADQYGFVGHQAVLPYEELLNVPLLAKMPGQMDSVKTHRELVQTIDVVSTVVDMISGLDLPVQGESIRPIIEEGASTNEYVYSDSPTLGGNIRYRSLRSTDYKYIRTKTESISLSDLRSQPERTIFSFLRQLVSPQEVLFEVTDENRNMSSDLADLTQMMANQLDEIMAENETWDEYTAEASTVSEPAQDRLEQLGYVD